MAGTTIAYGEITILDLIDTATYIYYSANEDGTGASTAPDANTKYIGIYSGPALEDGQPSIPPKDTIWSKYVGEDGAPGTSITIKNTQIKYIVTEEDIQPSTTANWQNSIPTTPQGSYLWTWTRVVYSDNSSTDTFSKSYLGKDANAYYIETNQEEVLIFKTSQGDQISPTILKIKMYKLPLTSNSEPIDFSKNYSFGYINSAGVFENLITEDYASYYENNETSKVFSYSIQNLINDHANAIPPDAVLKFAYLENNEEIAIKVIPYQFGTSEDMAKFALTANNIQMAVNESKLVFDATYGLTVQNGGIRIISKDGTDTLMEYDSDSNALKIVGSGKFTGMIHATGGEFTGDVSANTLTAYKGNIGGFIIDSNGLYSKNGAIKTEDEYNTSNSNIRLLGEDGKIYAKNITLGTSAQIEEYIQLGDARLWNPKDAKAEGRLLEAGKIKLNEEGVLQLGTTKPDGTSSIIKLDGTTSTIAGNNWSITPELATFQNINVSGKISTAVFEQNHIQSVGGSMMFKPSYKINSQSSNTVIIDKKATEDFLGEVGDYVYLVKQDGTTIDGLIQIDDINGDTIMLSKQMPNDTLVSMIILGKEKDLIIGINSNNGPDPSNFLKPCGFTITEFTLGGTTGNKYVDMTQNPKVFFGDLDKSGITFTDSQDLKGFGLYSENVYLTGSLTTQIDNNSGSTYAGINTLNGATATNGSKIVFWAGATNMSSIAKAPFQVTDTGSLYASQGVFEGAIISKSEIKGADIYAARIHGYLNGQSNSLTFYDASKGIIFKKGDYYGKPNEQDKSIEIFSIGEEGLCSNNKYFIDITNGKIKFIGNEIQTSDYFTNKAGTSFLHLHLKDNQILGSHIEENSSEKIYTNISFNKEELSFGLNTQGDFVINSNEIQLKKDTVKMNKTVLFGERLKYEQTTNGYNLYVL